MNTQGLLDRLLGAGKSLLNDSGVTTPEGGVSEFGKGAATGGLLGLLLGSKTGRKLAIYGGLAAVAAVAWRAYKQYRAKGSQVCKTSEVPDSVPPVLLLSAQTESRVVLRTVLPAAREDDPIAQRERALIDEEIAHCGGNAPLPKELRENKDRAHDIS